MMTQPNNTDVNRSSWRSRYQVHPCADVFPMMSDPELDALAADIKEHGLQKTHLDARHLGPEERVQNRARWT